MTLALNRPKRGNSLTAEMTDEITEACNWIRSKPRIRLMVLTGTGKYFCTGMDLQQAQGSSDDEGGNAHGKRVSKFQEFFRAVGTLPIPTLCLLNGPAMGGGVGLFFMCDIRVSTSPDHYLALSEVKRGLLPALISPWIVGELGRSMSTELMLGGRIKIDRLYPSGRLSAIIGDKRYPPLTYEKECTMFQDEQHAVDYYSKLAVSAAPTAFSDIKSMIRDLLSSRQDWERQESVVRDAFQKMMGSEEAAYGMMSFLNKEVPNWESRSKL